MPKIAIKYQRIGAHRRVIAIAMEEISSEENLFGLVLVRAIIRKAYVCFVGLWRCREFS